MTDKTVEKKAGRRAAGTWGRAAKKVGKRAANRAGRRKAKLRDIGTVLGAWPSGLGRNV